MGVVALASVRSCGVTTLAVALTATWPGGRRVLLAELDPAGGTLAAASGWAPEPGLVSLAAAARRGVDPELVWEHCQALPGGMAVLAGPASPDQARSALGMLAGLAGRLDELDADVLVDCGRLGPGSPSLDVVAMADRVVLAARPRLADLHAVATWTDTHPLHLARLGLVLVGDGPYPDAEIADTLGVEVLARLPWDPDAAAALVSAPASARQVRVSPLVRAARSLADRLADQLRGEPASTSPHPAPAAVPSARSMGLLRNRALGGWRVEPATPSPNGSTPAEVSR